MAGELLETIPQARPPARKPAYKRVTQEQLRIMLPMHRAGKTQAEIAQVLGCSQQTVSRWLTELTDSTDDATAYLRGNALRMAQTVVKKGKPDVQLKALQGLGVAAQGEQKSGLVIQIGIKDSDVSLTFACSTQQVAGEKP